VFQSYNRVGFNECLVLLQFLNRFENNDLFEILRYITSFPISYVDLLYLPLIIEKLYEKYYRVPDLAQRLVLIIFSV